MRRRLFSAAAVTALASALLSGGSWPAEATPIVPASVVSVPCSVSALTADISGSGAGDTLNLATGCTYTLTSALPVIDHSLSIGGDDGTLERSFAPGTPTFTMLQANAGSLSITDLSFVHGAGAIGISMNATLSVTGGTFTDNTAIEGSAIDDLSLDSACPVITDVTFIGNHASDAGGAISCETTFRGESGVEITDSNFIGNSATGVAGAILDDSIGESVTGSVFKDNSAGNGGVFGFSADGGASLDDDTFTNNHATGDGGVVVMGFSNDLQVIDSTISGNTAGGDGGAVWADNLGTLAVTGSVFRSNRAANGGAIYTSSLENGISGATFLDNQASGHGGGIDLIGERNENDMSLTKTKVILNKAGAGGGGIFDDLSSGFAVTTATDSAIYGNQPDNCEPLSTITGCHG